MESEATEKCYELRGERMVAKGSGAALTLESCRTKYEAIRAPVEFDNLRAAVFLNRSLDAARDALLASELDIHACFAMAEAIEV